MNIFKHLSRLLPRSGVVAALARIEVLAWINVQQGVQLMEDFSALSTTLDEAQTQIDALQDTNKGLFDTVSQMATDILALRDALTPTDNQAQIDALKAKAQSVLDGINKAKADVAAADTGAEVVEPPVVTPPADTPPADTPPADTPPADTPPADTPPAPADIAIL